MLQPQQSRVPDSQPPVDGAEGLMIAGGIIGAGVTVLGFVFALPLALIGVLIIGLVVYGWTRHQQAKREDLRVARQHDLATIKTRGKAVALPAKYNTDATVATEVARAGRDVSVAKITVKGQKVAGKNERRLAETTQPHVFGMEELSQKAETERLRIAEAAATDRARIEADAKRSEREANREMKELEAKLTRMQTELERPFDVENTMWEVFGKLTQFQEEVRDKAIRFPSQRDRFNSYLESLGELKEMLREGVKQLDDGTLDADSRKILQDNMLAKMGAMNDQYMDDMRRG